MKYKILQARKVDNSDKVVGGCKVQFDGSPVAIDFTVFKGQKGNFGRLAGARKDPKSSRYYRGIGAVTDDGNIDYLSMGLIERDIQIRLENILKEQRKSSEVSSESEINENYQIED